MPKSEEIILVMGRTNPDGTIADSPALRAWLSDAKKTAPGSFNVNGIQISVSADDTVEDIIRKHRKARKQQS